MSVRADRPVQSGTRSRRCQHGSAIVDFVLVSVVLVPLFFAVLQLALIWHVKTTLTSAASQGARYGASYQRTAVEGQRLTGAVIDDVLGSSFVAEVTARDTSVEGQPGVEVDVRAEVPVLAFWGPRVEVEVHGHAIKEVLP
ncbi:MAG: TadE/TadG family type IV pilus assembly protein [Nocardioidaceae bacterium]